MVVNQYLVKHVVSQLDACKQYATVLEQLEDFRCLIDKPYMTSWHDIEEWLLKRGLPFL